MNQVERFNYQVPKELSDFDPHDFIAATDEYLQETIGPKERVVVSASGGVDSTVVAHLLKRALDDRVYAFFLNDGLRRQIRGQEEADVTEKIFESFGENFRIYNTNFVSPIEGIEGGEAKRMKFRDLYTKKSKKVINELKADRIADGTIAPDIIETDGKVKTQHNVNLNYGKKKLEIISSLYKPHVRRVGEALGLPPDAVFKIPCPGPAQLLRVAGKFSQEKLWISKIATDIVETAVDNYVSLMSKDGSSFDYDPKTGIRTPFQMFAVVLDNKMKRNKKLSESIHEDCFRMENQATYIEGEKRDKPLYKNIIWTDGVLDYVDDMQFLQKDLWEKHGWPRAIYEVADGKRGAPYAVSMRIVKSPDAVTAQPLHIPFAYLQIMGDAIMNRCPQVGRVGYDISSKRPATIEIE